jgi:hypothetical protein
LARISQDVSKRYCNPFARGEIGRLLQRVNNGYVGRSTGTSAVPRKADDFGAPRKSVALGQLRKSQPLPGAPEIGVTLFASLLGRAKVLSITGGGGDRICRAEPLTSRQPWAMGGALNSDKEREYRLSLVIERQSAIGRPTSGTADRAAAVVQLITSLSNLALASLGRGLCCQ